MELAQALHELVGQLDAAAEAVLQEEFGVTHSRLSFLMPLVRQGPLDVSSLAATNRVSTAAVSKRIGWFVERDLVRADNPAGDAKRVLLALTPQGRRLARAASGRLAGRLEDLLAPWPEERRVVFLQLVQEVTEAIRVSDEAAPKERT